ncbi:ribosomal protein L22/L17 [Phlebopus sp. FC_14]|nr:ribosomal protein L22/L17 [Phlebopus sp. FC_14]
MQSLGRRVRRGANVRCHPQLFPQSRIQWDGRRTLFGPIDWIKQRFAPAPKKPKAPMVVAQEPPEPVPVQEDVFVSPKLKKERKKASEEPRRPPAAEHKYSTANFKISHRKLNMLGRQISGKPIDHAIMQMRFSEKRASNRIKSMLATARFHATVYKNMDPSKLVVAEAWVTKGPRTHKRIEPRGRGKFGIRVHPDSRMSVILRPGKTFEELRKEERERRLKRIVSAGIVREDVPLRNPASIWQW